ncbi:peroxiredoxin [Oceanicella sp. SM1341]|uniref:peroxiredoxin n=1 Tax=Oceanicella sp. SM1341 TaxID=1548889 RepID=UPI000E4BE02C|nr:peroxiredoxin [Oceanicella sp. SM1341]
MAISTGDTLPEASFVKLGPNGPEAVSTAELFKGRKVALFAVPGAYTPTCHNTHVPSFVKAAEALSSKGVDEIVCVSVNDPFVMKAWGEATGAADAGITMLADPLSDFTTKVGMDFSAPPVGLMSRSKRYSMFVEDGVVKVLNVEAAPGETVCSLGETLVDQI